MEEIESTFESIFRIWVLGRRTALNYAKSNCRNRQKETLPAILAAAVSVPARERRVEVVAFNRGQREAQGLGPSREQRRRSSSYAGRDLGSGERGSGGANLRARRTVVPEGHPALSVLDVVGLQDLPGHGIQNVLEGKE